MGEHLCYLLEHLVAGLVPKAIVTRFKVIQIENDQPRVPPGQLCLRDRLFQGAIEDRAIG